MFSHASLGLLLLATAYSAPLRDTYPRQPIDVEHYRFALTLSDSTDRIVGVHVVGTYASELIWGAAALIEQELRAGDVQEIIFPHPTVCEVVRDAVRELE